MSFLEVQFPPDLAFGSTGGPERRTDIVQLASGFEERNSTWANSRRRYDATRAIERVGDVYRILNLWEAAGGRLRGFRFRDPFDFRSKGPEDPVTPFDCSIGTGDGADTTFQLVKRYSAGGQTWVRTIAKPVRGSVRVAVNGAELAASAFTVDYATGVVTCSSAPANGHAVTAGFEFDTPVRFDTDKLDLTLAGFKAGQVPQIPLVEIRV